MSVHTKKRKSLEKAGTMMGLMEPIHNMDSFQSPQGISPLTKPPRLNENSLNFLNDIQSQHSGRSGSRNKTKKQGSLLAHIQLPEPSVRVTAREHSQDNKSQKSKKSKKNNKDGMLFNPSSNQLAQFGMDNRDLSYQKMSERSNSKSQKRKTVKENSILDFKSNNESLEELMNRNHKRPQFSPMPSSLVELSHAPSDRSHNIHIDPYKPMMVPSQRTNNLVRVPEESNEQKIGIPYNPASRTLKPQVGRDIEQISNASSLLQYSAKLLQSSKNTVNRERKKIFTKTQDSQRIHRPPRDQQFHLSDSDEGSHKMPVSRGNQHHMKVTQLKYSSTPPKNQQYKNDSVMFNFQNQPDNSTFIHNQSKNNGHGNSSIVNNSNSFGNVPVKQKKRGLNLLPREPSQDSSFDQNRSRQTSKQKKAKKPKESSLLPQTNNKYFDFSVPKSPRKPNDSFYQDEPPALQSEQAPRIISFDDDDQIYNRLNLKSNTIGGQSGFIPKIPSMTADNFHHNDNRFDQSMSSIKYPTTKPPRSVSSKRSNGSQKSSSLIDSAMSSNRDTKIKVTLSELASQKNSNISKSKSKDKKKQSTLLQFYQNSSQDNRSNHSKDSKRSGKKESSLIDMNRFSKKNPDNNYQRHNNHSKYQQQSQDDFPEVMIQQNPKDKKKNKQMSIRELEEVQSRVITKNCYTLNNKGKVVRQNCVIQLSGRNKSKQRQPSFYETQLGKNYMNSTKNLARKNSRQTKNSFGQNSSKYTNRNRQSPKHSYGYDSQSRNRSRQRNNFNDSSLNQFYRPRQQMKHQPMKPDDFYLKHYYNENDERSYTYQYYGSDSEQEQIQRVSFNAMFAKNNSNSNRLPRTQTSASKYNNRNR